MNSAVSDSLRYAEEQDLFYSILERITGRIALVPQKRAFGYRRIDDEDRNALNSILGPTPCTQSKGREWTLLENEGVCSQLLETCRVILDRLSSETSVSIGVSETQDVLCMVERQPEVSGIVLVINKGFLKRLDHDSRQFFIARALADDYYQGSEARLIQDSLSQARMGMISDDTLADLCLRWLYYRQYSLDLVASYTLSIPTCIQILIDHTPAGNLFQSKDLNDSLSLANQLWARIQPSTVQQATSRDLFLASRIVHLTQDGERSILYQPSDPFKGVDQTCEQYLLLHASIYLAMREQSEKPESVDRLLGRILKHLKALGHDTPMRVLTDPVFSDVTRTYTYCQYCRLFPEVRKKVIINQVSGLFGELLTEGSLAADLLEIIRELLAIPVQRGAHLDYEPIVKVLLGKRVCEPIQSLKESRR